MRPQVQINDATPARCFLTSGAGVGEPLDADDALFLTGLLAGLQHEGEHDVVQIIARALRDLTRDLSPHLDHGLSRVLTAWADLADDWNREPSLRWTTDADRRRVLAWLDTDSSAAADLVRRLFAHRTSWTTRRSLGPGQPRTADDLGSLTRPARRCRLGLGALDRSDRRAALREMYSAGLTALNRADRRALRYGNTVEPSAPAWEHVEPLPPPDPLRHPRAAQAPPRTAWALAA